jgi:hypothetical protein
VDAVDVTGLCDRRDSTTSIEVSRTEAASACGRRALGGQETRAVDWKACPRPVAGIQVNEVADGYVIYDPNRERVHYLNHTAVVLLELCTGHVKAGDLPGLLQTAYGLPEPPVVEVTECLEKLFREGLVT